MRIGLLTVILATICSSFLVSGCGNREIQAKQERVLTRTPIGRWYGNGVMVNFEASGDVQWQQNNGPVIQGAYTYDEDTGGMTVTLNGEDYDMPFKRDGLSLTLTLPNETEPVELQME